MYFTDTEPPKLSGAAPTKLTLMCHDPIPDKPKLAFSDNCFEDAVVDGTESEPVGSVCTGRVINRTWAGPTDACGNTADDITQTITILDQENPEFVAALGDIRYTCPQGKSTLNQAARMENTNNHMCLTSRCG